jgi:GH24 family phage-related lysozyme (muramidase)
MRPNLLTSIPQEEKKPSYDFRKWAAVTGGNEGFEEKAYLDTKGILTIGYGFNLEEPIIRKKLLSRGFDVDGMIKGKVSMTKAQSLPILEEIYKESFDTTKSKFSNFDSFPDEVKHVLTDMVFNMGETRFDGFKKMKAALSKNDYAEAARQIADSSYAKQVGKRVNRNIDYLKSSIGNASNVKPYMAERVEPVTIKAPMREATSVSLSSPQPEIEPQMSSDYPTEMAEPRMDSRDAYVWGPSGKMSVQDFVDQYGEKVFESTFKSPVPKLANGGLTLPYWKDLDKQYYIDSDRTPREYKSGGWTDLDRRYGYYGQYPGYAYGSHVVHGGPTWPEYAMGLDSGATLKQTLDVLKGNPTPKILDTSAQGNMPKKAKYPSNYSQGVKKYSLPEEGRSLYGDGGSLTDEYRRVRSTVPRVSYNAPSNMYTGPTTQRGITFGNGGPTDPEPPVESGLGTQVIRAGLYPFLSTNARQLAASMVTQDSKYGLQDAPEGERIALYNTLERARKRTGQNKGGTEYVDYGAGYNADLEHFQAAPLNVLAGSALSSDFNAATTFGRVSYEYDPKTQTYKVYDSYDFSKTPNTQTAYSQFRNAVGKAAAARDISPKGKTPNYIGSMSKNEYQNRTPNPGLLDFSYSDIKNTLAPINSVINTGYNYLNKAANYLGFENGGPIDPLPKVKRKNFVTERSTTATRLSPASVNNYTQTVINPIHDTSMGTLVQLLDRTGMSNYPDLYRSLQTGENVGANIIGSLPLIGIVGDALKLLKGARTNIPLPEIGIKYAATYNDLNPYVETKKENGGWLDSYAAGGMIKRADGSFVGMEPMTNLNVPEPRYNKTPNKAVMPVVYANEPNTPDWSRGAKFEDGGPTDPSNNNFAIRPVTYDTPNRFNIPLVAWGSNDSVDRSLINLAGYEREGFGKKSAPFVDINLTHGSPLSNKYDYSYYDSNSPDKTIINTNPDAYNLTVNAGVKPEFVLGRKSYTPKGREKLDPMLSISPYGYARVDTGILGPGILGTGNSQKAYSNLLNDPKYVVTKPNDAILSSPSYLHVNPGIGVEVAKHVNRGGAWPQKYSGFFEYNTRKGPQVGLKAQLDNEQANAGTRFGINYSPKAGIGGGFEVYYNIGDAYEKIRRKKTPPQNTINSRYKKDGGEINKNNWLDNL